MRVHLFPGDIPLERLRQGPRRVVEGLHLASGVVLLLFLGGFMGWAAELVRTAQGLRLKVQTLECVGFALFLIVGPIFFYAVPWLAFLALAVLLRWREGWTAEQIRGLRLHGDLPAHWLDPAKDFPDPPARKGGQAASVVPLKFAVLASTLALATAVYVDYAASHHIWSPGRAPLALGVMLCCPALLHLSIGDLCRLGFAFARVYNAVISLLGCLFAVRAVFAIVGQS